jgi:hypothetical protein
MLSDKLVDRVRRRAREIAQSWPVQKPPFALLTGWSKSYDDILSGTFVMTLHEDQVLDHALTTGRAILSGRGGDGKTWLLRRLYGRALAAGDVAIFVDLKQWSGGDYAEWTEWTRDNVGDGADFLFRRFSGLELGAIDIDRLPPESRKIVFVDGLNEINAKVGLEVLTVFDEIVASHINMSVLVADRLVRRELPNLKRWLVGSPLPLSHDEVRKHLGKGIVLATDDIRTSPFFLDAVLKAGSGGGRRAATLERLVYHHGGLSEADLLIVAKAAYDAYLRSRSRMFEREAFELAVGKPLAAKLEEAGTVRFIRGGGFFQHHMVHDFLAAHFASKQDPSTWGPSLFRTLSFDASSFDAIEFAFEQLDRDRADLFLQKLYDWNLYAAGYALAQARGSDDPVGPEMRTVIYAMLADKRFDPVLATSQRASDALRLMQLADAQPFRQAANIGEVCTAVQLVDSNIQWFIEWKNLFGLAETGNVTDAELAMIKLDDSIIGWTVANVAKRAANREWMIPVLIQWLKDDVSATVRWRIAHVLGSLPSAPTLEQLLQLLDHDGDEDVKYGAVRSVVELAAIADPELRAAARAAIEQRASVICSSDRVARELRSCLLINPTGAPEGWLDFVRDCVKAQFLHTEKLSERDLWRGCLNTAERLYQPAAVPTGN